jgi:hypothetical protein
VLIRDVLDSSITQFKVEIQLDGLVDDLGSTVMVNVGGELLIKLLLGTDKSLGSESTNGILST